MDQLLSLIILINNKLPNPNTVANSPKVVSIDTTPSLCSKIFSPQSVRRPSIETQIESITFQLSGAGHKIILHYLTIIYKLNFTYYMLYDLT